MYNNPVVLRLWRVLVGFPLYLLVNQTTFFPEYHWKDVFALFQPRNPPGAIRVEKALK